MTKFKTTLLTFFSVSLLSTAAFAQQAPAQDAPQAPGEDKRGKVSQINGTPIPVGTHNEYYYDFKKTNISTNPIGWVLGSYGVSASYAVHENVAIRGDINYYNPPGDDDLSGYEVGIGVPVYFRRAYQGPFLEPGLIVRGFEDNDIDESTSTVGPQVLAGWAWMWDSGLNVSFALGAGRNFSSDDEYDEVFANGYLRFGYAF